MYSGKFCGLKNLWTKGLCLQRGLCGWRMFLGLPRKPTTPILSPTPLCICAMSVSHLVLLFVVAVVICGVVLGQSLPVTISTIFNPFLFSRAHCPFLASYPGLRKEGLVHTVSCMCIHVIKYKLIMQSSKWPPWSNVFQL